MSDKKNVEKSDVINKPFDESNYAKLDKSIKFAVTLSCLSLIILIVSSWFVKIEVASAKVVFMSGWLGYNINVLLSCRKEKNRRKAIYFGVMTVCLIILLIAGVEDVFFK